MSVFVLDGRSAGVFIGTVDNSLLQLPEVVVRNRLRESQLLGEDKGYTNLIGLDVRIGRDNTTSSKVDTFAHHVLSEQTFLLLENLLDTVRLC